MLRNSHKLILSLSLVFAALAMILGPVAGQDAPSADSIILPNGQSIDEVDFEKHVVRLLSRNGCNAADCHGSFQGRGGMRLSLFSYSAKMDYEALTGDDTSGRVDREVAADSQVLLKPSGGDEHEGGIRFEEDSWEYQLFERWIAEGATWNEDSGRVATLTVNPGIAITMKVGETTSLEVLADYVDGTRSSVTMFSVFRSNNEAIAEVDADGTIKANRIGDTSIVVEYGGVYQAVSILIPREAQPNILAQSNEAIGNVDRLINEKLQRLAIEPSSRCDDATFLRRVMLDTIGTLPTAEDVLLFVNDPDPQKREKKIDALLRHPRHASLWAMKYCDITACRIDWIEGPAELAVKRAQMWHDWFRVRFEENVPYDEIAKGVICATSTNDRTLEEWIDSEIELIRSASDGFQTTYAERPSLDLFWRRQKAQGAVELEDMAELVGTAFLGIRMNCARCHKHPFDQWSQQDYLSFGNQFSRVRFDASTALRTAVMDRLDAQREAKKRGETTIPIPRLQEVHVSGPWRKLVDPETGFAPAPAALRDPGQPWEDDPRDAFYEWLTQPDNPYFAPSFVNRVWAHYLGRGFVEPVDAFSVTNPASHPELLAQLSKSFIESGFDLRELERVILLSDTYQRSATPNSTNVDDEQNFSRALIKPLMAELVVDAIHDVLGTEPDFDRDAPEGARAIDLGADRVGGTDGNKLQLLGKQPRTELCDCNRDDGPSLRGAILMMSDAGLTEQIKNQGVDHLWSSARTDEENVKHLFLSTVSRMPDERELGFALTHLAEATDQQSARADLIWGLLNTREFITKH